MGVVNMQDSSEKPWRGSRRWNIRANDGHGKDCVGDVGDVGVGEAGLGSRAWREGAVAVSRSHVRVA